MTSLWSFKWWNLTSSFSSLRSDTRVLTVFSSSSLRTFSGLIAHFQIAPVTAARRGLSSHILTSFASFTSGSSPPCWRTRSLVTESWAHCHHTIQCVNGTVKEYVNGWITTGEQRQLTKLCGLWCEWEDVLKI